MPAYELDEIIGRLSKGKQRATYTAVAKNCGRSARSLMSGKARNALNSWVVAKKNGRPTGYAPSEIDPALGERPQVISEPSQLIDWLTRSPQITPER